MISADFAPNETFADVLASLKMLVQPYAWRRGKHQARVKARIKHFFPNQKVYFFLTARASLYQAIHSLGLKRGDEVLVQAFTCEAVILPILAEGLRPVYIDIEDRTYSMGVSDLEKKISEKARVLILQHTFGLIPKYRTRILELAAKHNLTVIEDLAHGFDKNFFRKDTENTMKLLSFGRSKALSSVWGGSIILPESQASKKISTIEKRLAYPSFWFIWSVLWYKPLVWFMKLTYDLYLGKILHFIFRNISSVASEITPKEKGGEFDQSLNKAYPNALSGLLLQQLKNFEQIYNTRASVSRKYNGFLGQKFPEHELTLTKSNSALIRYPFLVDEPDKLVAAARRRGVFLGRWYRQVVDPSVVDLAKMQYKKGSCPTAEAICSSIINLPTLITPGEAKQVLALL